MKDSPVSPFWKHLDQFPPVKVRLLAHGDGNAPVWISHAELAITSGISLSRVIEISAMLNWDRVTFSEMRRFCAACRFDPTACAQRQRVKDYEYRCLKRNSQPMQWLKRSPRYEQEVKPLIHLLNRSLSQHVA